MVSISRQPVNSRLCGLRPCSSNAAGLTLEEIAGALKQNPKWASQLLDATDSQTTKRLAAATMAKISPEEAFEAQDVNRDGVVDRAEFLTVTQ